VDSVAAGSGFGTIAGAGWLVFIREFSPVFSPKAGRHGIDPGCGRGFIRGTGVAFLSSPAG
jgi:hypothetical protein